MSVQFSGWEVVDDGASYPGVELRSSQKPQNQGVYAMYHGTSVASARLIIASGFKQSLGGTLGRGVYVSRDRGKASNYPLSCNSADRVVLEVRVRVGRVKRIDRVHVQHSWQASGYDTAWIPPSAGRLEEDCVFDPKRVEVVGVAKAPTPGVQTELLQLIGKKARGAAAAVQTCALCRRKTQQGAQHVTQRCWACGETICVLAPKHFCPAKP